MPVERAIDIRLIDIRVNGGATDVWIRGSSFDVARRIVPRHAAIALSGESCGGSRRQRFAIRLLAQGRG